MANKITRVLLAPALGGFFNDDQAAIRQGAVRQGQFYQGTPLTSGFDAIRIPAQCLSVGLQLEDGFVAWGDMMSVQYAAAAGRDELFKQGEQSRKIRNHLIDQLVGRDVAKFKPNANFLSNVKINGENLHVGVQYGLSQAFLAASAHISNCTMAERVCAEYEYPVCPVPVPVYAQSGDDRYGNVDKMLLKRVDVLPHGLINNSEKFGAEGEIFLEYVNWVVQRIRKLGGDDYRPILYFDIYGMPGFTFDNSVERVVDYLVRVEQAAAPFTLRIESPMNLGSVDAQIEGFARIRRLLKERGSSVEIIVDEWCNTLEDIDQYIAAQAVDLVQIKMPDMGGVDKTIDAIARCHRAGIGAYLGGSCTETDLSARTSVHIAVATQVEMLLAKPGMGVDEALMIVGNEQSRLITQLQY